MCQLSRDEPRGDGAADDRHETGGGVGAEHDFEGVEGAGQWCRKRGADCSCGATGHQKPHVVTAGGQPLADMRSEHRADLGIARLQPDRSAEPVRQESLDRDQQAAAKGDPATIERIGLDRVGELLSLHAPGEVQSDHRQYQAAEHRDEQRTLPGDNAGGAEMCVDRNVEQQRVRYLAEARDRGDEHAAEQSDDDGDQHETSLATAHEIAQEQRQQADAGSHDGLRRMRSRLHSMRDPSAARCARRGSRYCSTKSRACWSFAPRRGSDCSRTRDRGRIRHASIDWVRARGSRGLVLA